MHLKMHRTFSTTAHIVMIKCAEIDHSFYCMKLERQCGGWGLPEWPEMRGKEVNLPQLSRGSTARDPTPVARW